MFKFRKKKHIPTVYNVVDYDWLRDHLVCEFDHWDVCLTGLVYDHELLFCEIRSDKKYNLYQINWTEECAEYLKDYKVAYKHWFYTDGIRRTSYEGWDLNWFYDKWKRKSPIEKNLK
jgi:hypothetical protein